MYDIDTLKGIDDLSGTISRVYEDYRTDFERHLQASFIKWVGDTNVEVSVSCTYLEIILPKNCMLNATQLYAIEHVLKCEFIQTVNSDVRRYHFKWV